MIRKFNQLQKIIILVFLVCGLWAAERSSVCAQPKGGTAELNGDVVEYVMDGNAVKASGNVIIEYQGATLYCDEVLFYRDTKIAEVKGPALLVSEQGEIHGRDIVFNFITKTGEFHNARIASFPYFGEAQRISKVGDEKIVMENGYFTTSDYDKPGYRMKTPKIEVYPGKKVVARHVTTVLGQVPVMYVPKYSQSLQDRRTHFSVTPGYQSDWGGFLLAKWRFDITEDVQAAIHLDYRERKDLAEGLDVNYKTREYGQGSLRTYYMNERTIGAKHLWKERTQPSTERERYRIAWRHKWDIDEKTNAIWQFHRLSDSTILKDYFESEYDNDVDPKTFFLMTRTLPHGMLSLRSDLRVNSFVTEVERLPEIRYDLTNQELFDSGFYLKNVSSYVNLDKEHAAPSSTKEKTQRIDTDSEISYPMKIGFVEVKPFVGTELTYYSRAKDPADYDALRSLFRVGSSMSTKFYRVWDTQIDAFGLHVDKLRHVITPSVLYDFHKEPNMDASKLDQFDAIDSRTQVHKFKFALENKLQTKRDGATVDLLRAVLETNYRFKDDAVQNNSGFDGITLDLDFKPTSWMTLYADANYNTQEEVLSTANFDMYINGGSKWDFSIGKRYNREVDDLITLNANYHVNKKWSVGLYERFDVDKGNNKETELRLTRDLHSWTSELIYNHTRGEGDAVLLVFRLKAFPDIGMEAGKTYNKRKPGAGSLE